jgi:predicted nucleotidyltransferase
MRFGLEEKQLELINSVFANNNKVKSVKIFGSRAKGNYHTNSDIDLAIEGEVDDKETQLILSELEELPLPYIFDVKAVKNINNIELINHIKRVGITIYGSNHNS